MPGPRQDTSVWGRVEDWNEDPCIKAEPSKSCTSVRRDYRSSTHGPGKWRWGWGREHSHQKSKPQVRAARGFRIRMGTVHNREVGVISGLLRKQEQRCPLQENARHPVSRTPIKIKSKLLKIKIRSSHNKLKKKKS